MSIKHVLFAFFVCLIWGVNFAVMKIGLEQLDPFIFGLVRFSIVLLLLLPWLKIIPGAMLKLFILGNLIGGFQFALVFLGMDMTDHVSAMSVVVQMNIPITLILAHFFLSERMSYWRTGGVIVSFVGGADHHPRAKNTGRGRRCSHYITGYTTLFFRGHNDA